MKGLLCSAATLTVLVAFNGIGVRSFAPTAISLQRATFRGTSNRDESPRSSALAALTPIGPLCPFRSTASLEVDKQAQKLHSKSPTFVTDVQMIQLDMHCGNDPDPTLLMRVANDMDDTVSDWENMLKTLHGCGDFQTQEYAKLIDAHMRKYGLSATSVASMIRWQSGCMKAMALRRPPPQPPKDLDLTALMRGDRSSKSPSMTSMMRAVQISSVPFNSDSFEGQPVVQQEYEQLCREHSDLVEVGASYSKFDATAKLSYLDNLAKIQDRWDVFFERFRLMGKLDQKFESQSQQFLTSMSLTEDGFRSLLSKTHQRMREEAERQRRSSVVRM